MLEKSKFKLLSLLTVYTLAGGEWVGVNISEDARHWIGLLQYNPSTAITVNGLQSFLSSLSVAGRANGKGWGRGTQIRRQKNTVGLFHIQYYL
jgi:hypothetical protein